MAGKRWLIISVFLLGMVAPATAEIIFVDDDANGLNDGTSWADAYNYLQDALTDANSSTKPVEIRVAQGIHKPDHGMNQHLEDQYASFQLQNHVTIKGGYGGIGEPDPNARDIAAYETIFSGEISDDEDTLHVVCGSGTDKTAVLDGFTITGGCAWSSNNNLGGGMYNYAGSPTVRNCTFFENSARNFGGGMCNDGNSCPTLINCIFKNNSATDGGGMDNEYSNPILINCTFSGNSACSYNADTYGGAGMYNYKSNPSLINCLFTGNTAQGWGDAGGMQNNQSSPTLTNCIFSGNSSDRYGGGMYNHYDSSPTLTNCTFTSNSAVSGGAIYITGEFQGTLTDCLFENNAAIRYGGAISYIGSGELNIIRCDFHDGSAERGGAIYSYASLVLSQCILVNNQAEYAGAIDSDGDITLTNCLLANNQALVWGGALSNMTNTSRSVNCTFVGNSANYGGAIFSNIECDTIAINSIFWNNTAQTGSQIATSGSHGGSTLTVNYCDIENYLDGLYVPSGCTLNWGEDNINAEPLFADSNNGNYHLLTGSPCIDNGDPNYVADPNETDLDGKPRIINGRIDMGAFEYRPSIPAEVRIVPRSINLVSKGKWITCYIWLGEDYDVVEIDPNSILLEDEIQAESLLVDEDQQIAIARFSRSEVHGILEVGDVELTISGQLTDGTVFEGTDVIRVIDKGGGGKIKD